MTSVDGDLGNKVVLSFSHSWWLSGWTVMPTPDTSSCLCPCLCICLWAVLVFVFENVFVMLVVPCDLLIELWAILSFSHSCWISGLPIVTTLAKRLNRAESSQIWSFKRLKASSRESWKHATRSLDHFSTGWNMCITHGMVEKNLSGGQRLTLVHKDFPNTDPRIWLECRSPQMLGV